ncbi:MAG TPA: hypothetical protein VIE41_16485 [Methylomirabilota bacterium]|jgi:hypothetical protein
MGKSWMVSLLTLAIALGLIGLLAYTSESVHHVAYPARTVTDVARPRATPAPAEREMGPTLHGTGLMLTH